MKSVDFDLIQKEYGDFSVIFQSVSLERVDSYVVSQFCDLKSTTLHF